MNNQHLQLIGFSVLLAAVGVIVLLMWLPFLKLVAMAAILAILFYPIYKRIERRIKSRSLSSLLTIILILVIVMVPLWFVGNVLINELVNLYNQFKSGPVAFDQSALIQHLPAALRNSVENLASDITQRLSRFSSNIFQILSNLASNVAGFVVSFFLIFISLYYLLKDGDKIKTFVSGIFPFSERNEHAFYDKLSLSVKGVVQGSFLVALAQGIVAVIGFMIFGVPQPLLWGVFTMLAAFVPTFGTSLSLVPAVLYLLITGHTAAAVGMAIWGAVAVGLIDNVISPHLIGSRVQLHPLLVLFSVIGGIAMFGFLGFLLGPILMAIFVSLLDMYRTDLKEYLNK